MYTGPTVMGGRSPVSVANSMDTSPEFMSLGCTTIYFVVQCTIPNNKMFFFRMYLKEY